MNSKSQNTGMGSYQENKAHYAQRAIFKALSDGQWHRNMNLKEITKLSSRTLAKHFRPNDKASIDRKESR